MKKTNYINHLRTLILVSYLLSASCLIMAQDFNWAKRIGGNFDEEIFSMKVGASGNVYLYGNFKSSVDFGEGNIRVGTFHSDYFISKYSPQGYLIWVKQIKNTKGKAYIGNMDIDNDENVYFTGSFGDTLDFDPDVAVKKIGSVGVQDGFVTKLDSTGNWIWTKLIGTKNATVTTTHITLDNSGNIIISSILSGKLIINSSIKTDTIISTNDNKIVLCKLNSSGNFIWSKSFTSTEKVNLNAIESDKSGNIYTSGSFTGTTNFNTNNGLNNLISTNNNYSDLFVCKLNALGDYVWAKQHAGKGDKYVNSIAVDNNENVYLIGAFTDSMDFDPGIEKTIFHCENRDAYLCKLDKMGKYLWAKQFGSYAGDEDGFQVLVNEDGNIFISGLFVEYCDFDFGPNTKYLFSNSPSMYVGKYNGNGELIWIEEIESNYSDPFYPAIPLTLAHDNNGHFYVSGIFGAYADFNPDKDVLNLASKGGWDIFLLSLIDKSNSGKIPKFSIQSKLYPNPTSGKFNINNLQGHSFQLYNHLGQLINNNQISFEYTGNNTVIDISSLPDGVYFLKAEAVTSNLSFKIIKN